MAVWGWIFGLCNILYAVLVSSLVFLLSKLQIEKWFLFEFCNTKTPSCQTPSFHVNSAGDGGDWLSEHNLVYQIVKRNNQKILLRKSRNMYRCSYLPGINRDCEQRSVSLELVNITIRKRKTIYCSTIFSPPIYYDDKTYYGNWVVKIENSNIIQWRQEGINSWDRSARSVLVTNAPFTSISITNSIPLIENNDIIQ